MSYTERVMEHVSHPRNVGRMTDADGVGKIGSPICGDVMAIYIKVKENVIIDAKFETFGCGAAIASGSIATEMIKGKTLEEALGISDEQVAEALGGLPKEKMHCSVLPEKAIKSAIADYRSRHE
jgi:nitrogen fixation NifU-like protein